jgi:hypothetical protein
VAQEYLGCRKGEALGIDPKEVSKCLIASRISIRGSRAGERPHIRILEHFADVATPFVPGPELAFDETREATYFVCNGSLVRSRCYELFKTLEALYELLAFPGNVLVKASQLLVCAHRTASPLSMDGPKLSPRTTPSGE